MKKEFKAPVVETKAFIGPEDIMVGVMLTSLGQANDKVAIVTDEAVAESFKIWKGIGQ